MTALEVYNPGTIGESIVVFGNLAAQIAKTDFVPQEFRGRPEAVLACMMYGSELGLGPMQSLNLTQSIKGRVGLKPEGMRALVLAAGHQLWTDEFTDARVVLCGQRKDTDKVESVDWTLERAKQAGLGSGDNWKKYPRAMLLARATSELCRLLFADVVGGLSYTPDELAEFDAPAEPVARRGAPKMAATRPRDTDVVVDTPELGLAEARIKTMNSGLPDAPPPSAPPQVDAETGEVKTRKRKPPTGLGGVGVASDKPPFVPADATTVAQVTDVIDGLRELGGEWLERGRAAWKAAGVPSVPANKLCQDDAELAFAAVQPVYVEACKANPAPTLDGGA